MLPDCLLFASIALLTGIGRLLETLGIVVPQQQVATER
jgi:hypothetical protein